MPLDFSEILVTGGAGFIGSHIVDRLLDEGFKVRVLDNLSTGDKKNLVHHQNKKTFQFIEGDIRNFELAQKAVRGVDAVIHEAALVSVTRSVENPLLSNEINVTGTLNLLKASADAHVKRFVLASSCAVYGDTETLPNHENLAPKPLSPYAVDKLAAEYYAKIFYDVYGLEAAILRYFNVYGPRQKHSPYSGVISVLINRLLEDKPPTIYGDGEQTRDFVNVKDVVEANRLALSKREAVGEVFNISTGEPITINKLTETLQKITGRSSIKPVHAEPRLGDIKHSYGDITKAKRNLGYEPKVQLEKGLSELVKAYSKQ
ncbi:MAG TPA: SDR family oxidoreductase [Candidatus Bathyarchaeota archaeon]|nr:SDR family oxidoreductase [Candidatus Bathyarchaeota archaeon]